MNYKLDTKKLEELGKRVGVFENSPRITITVEERDALVKAATTGILFESVYMQKNTNVPYSVINNLFIDEIEKDANDFYAKHGDEASYPALERLVPLAVKFMIDNFQVPK